MGITKRINLYLCSCASSPMMIGLVNPIILLPKIDLTHDELRFILKHELVHFKRKDLLYKYFVLAAMALHWFNPIVHLISKAIDVLCEISCDAEVVRSTDMDTRQHYIETIIEVIKYQSKFKTALSTNFYGGKKGMKNRIASIMDTGKKKAGFSIICGVLIITLGTGLVFAANTSTGASNGGMTAINDTSTSVIAEQYANRFEQYKDYGLTYNKVTNSLNFKGELVRYFEDYYPVSEDGNAYAGLDYFNENGMIDIHGVRDLTNIIHNADGSYDPSGKLTGVELYSQAEFDARDIENLKNPPLSSTTIHAENDMNYATSQTPQQNTNNSTYTATTNVTDSGLNNQGMTISQIFAEYKDYGITFYENSVNGGLGNVYYQGQLVKSFVDEKPNGGVLSLSSSDGGNIRIRTVYDDKEKLAGVEVVEN